MPTVRITVSSGPVATPGSPSARATRGTTAGALAAAIVDVHRQTRIPLSDLIGEVRREHARSGGAGRAAVPRAARPVPPFLSERAQREFLAQLAALGDALAEGLRPFVRAFSAALAEAEARSQGRRVPPPAVEGQPRDQVIVTPDLFREWNSEHPDRPLPHHGSLYLSAEGAAAYRGWLSLRQAGKAVRHHDGG